MNRRWAFFLGVPALSFTLAVSASAQRGDASPSAAAAQAVTSRTTVLLPDLAWSAGQTKSTLPFEVPLSISGLIQIVALVDSGADVLELNEGIQNQCSLSFNVWIPD